MKYRLATVEGVSVYCMCKRRDITRLNGKPHGSVNTYVDQNLLIFC